MHLKKSIDFRLRRQLQANCFQRFLYKTLETNKGVNEYTLRLCLAKMQHKVCGGLPKNYCQLSSKGRGVFRAAKMSRNLFKQSLNAGLFFGFKKHSW
jgi:ribosomal protein S14